MAITKVDGRQNVLVAEVTFAGGTDVTSAATYEAIDLPVGAIVVGGSFYTLAGFTGNGTVAVQVGSNVLIAAADYDAKTNAVFDMTTVDANADEITTQDTVDIVVAVAALTDGAGRLIVEYIMKDRATETVD